MWRAYDRDLQRFCAAKLLRQRDAGELLRFAREQAVRLNHPHVVSPYAWAADDGMVLIASELIDGGSLHTLLGDYGPLAEGTIVDVLDQVLDALGAVHDAHLIHRDVKPGNLLLRSGFGGPLQILLTDFGLTIGVRDARLTEVGTVIGTPGYLPPEVLKGGVSPDTRHDLYAVGRLALTMHHGSEVADALGYLPAIKDPALRRTVAALVSADPVERPGDTEAARMLLRDAARDQQPRTPDGDPIVVLQQLPELPADWAAGVELTSPRPTAGPRTRVDEVITQTLPQAPAATPTPTRTPTGTSTSRWWLGGAALAVVVTAVALLINTFSSDPGTTDNQTPGTPTSGATTVQATLVPATVEAGAECGWQEEGDQRSTPDGSAIVCQIVDGAYVWTAYSG